MKKILLCISEDLSKNKSFFLIVKNIFKTAGIEVAIEDVCYTNPAADLGKINYSEYDCVLFHFSRFDVDSKGIVNPEFKDMLEKAKQNAKVVIGYSSVSITDIKLLGNIDSEILNWPNLVERNNKILSHLTGIPCFETLSSEMRTCIVDNLNKI